MMKQRQNTFKAKLSISAMACFLVRAEIHQQFGSLYREEELCPSKFVLITLPATLFSLQPQGQLWCAGKTQATLTQLCNAADQFSFGQISFLQLKRWTVWYMTQCKRARAEAGTHIQAGNMPFSTEPNCSFSLSHNTKLQLENASVTSCHLLESIPVPSSKKHSMNPPRRSFRGSTREELFSTPTSKS